MILIQILKNVKKMMDQVGYKNYQYATVEFVKKIIGHKYNIFYLIKEKEINLRQIFNRRISYFNTFNKNKNNKKICKIIIKRF